LSRRLFTSESVTEGHPDKIADAISDAILDALLAQDRRSRVAVETMITTGQVHVAGEVTTDAYADIPFLVFHGTADTTVPIATSREFAALLPDQVQLIEVDGAEHIESWNPDPDAYDSAVRAFLGANV